MESPARFTLGNEPGHVYAIDLKHIRYFSKTYLRQLMWVQGTLAGWLHIVSLAPEDAEMYLNGLHCMTATKK
jgi:hypothetical protein